MLGSTPFQGNANDHVAAMNRWTKTTYQVQQKSQAVDAEFRSYTVVGGTACNQKVRIPDTDRSCEQSGMPANKAASVTILEGFRRELPVRVKVRSDAATHVPA